MTTIETRAHVGPDRKLTIDVPDDVPEGEHRVVVWLDHRDDEPDSPSELRLERKGSLVVVTGRGKGDIDFSEEFRRERNRRTIDAIFGSGE